MSQKAIDSAKAMFDLQVVATSLTAGMAFALALTGGLTLNMYDRIAPNGFEEPQEDNQNYADGTVGLANASYYIGIIVFYALSILLGYQGGKGKDALNEKSTKVANGFCQGFSFIAFIMLFATCGAGIKMFNSVETWSAKKECTTTTTTVAATATAPMMRSSSMKSRAETTEAEDADKSERKAVSIYNTYIAFLVIFGLLFGVYIWYIVRYSSYSSTISKYTSQASQYATNKYQAYKGAPAAAPPAAAPAIQGGRYAPAVSEFFTY